MTKTPSLTALALLKTDAPDRLVDGSTPATPERVLERLDRLGIEVVTHHHPPLFTVAEAKALRGPVPGAHLKNLFLRNKKGEMWLLSVRADRDLDLREVGTSIGSRSARMSFGSKERLMNYLGVVPGAVTPLAVINDVSHSVRVVLDSVLMEYDFVNVHPLDNRMTTSISPGDLLRFLESEGHRPEIVNFDTAP